MKTFRVLIFMILALPGLLFAGGDEVVSYLENCDFNSGGSLASFKVKDLSISEEATSLPFAVNRSLEVRLDYNRDLLTDLADKDWACEVTYDLHFLGGNIASITGQKLKIQSAGIAGSQIPLYKAIEVYNTGAYGAILKITDSKCDCGQTGLSGQDAVPSDIHLELAVKRERYWDMNVAAPVTVTYDANTGLLSWPFRRGAEHYEIEWNWLDAEASWPTGQEFHAAVRVSTANQWYRPDLSFPQGTVWFRVRPVGRFVEGVGNDFSYERFGDWSTPISYAINSGNTFEEDMPWQYVTTYAEDGKYKKVLNYMDGGLKARQSLTNLSTDGTTVATQSEFDAEGRPVIQTLPIPIQGDDLHWKPGLNVKGSNTPFKADDIVYGDNAGFMTQSNGASRYYSQYNTFTNSILRDYIPDADSFPYTQVEFMRDHTGRAKRQSGVGRDHRLGSGHETFIYYGDAEPAMLYRIFGENVGNPGHYLKKMTVDANGQVSIAYQDQEERVIATALAGDAPASLIELDYTAQTYTVDLMPKNILDLDNLSSDTRFQILNEWGQSPGKSYDFTYDLTGVLAEIACVCKECRYEVEVEILDPEGVPVEMNVTAMGGFIDQGNVAGSTAGHYTKLALLSEAPTGYDCAANTFYDEGDAGEYRLTFTAKFDQIGSYTVLKRLRVPEADLDSLAADLASCPDFPNLDSIADSLITEIDYSPCGMPCEDWVFATEIRDEQGNVITDPQQLQAIADELCNGVNSLTADDMEVQCDILEQQIVDQLSPGGVFYNATDWANYQSNPSANYTTWISTHREYCRLQICLDFADSRLFDVQQASVSEWPDANSAGYFNHLNDPAFLSGGPLDDAQLYVNPMATHLSNWTSSAQYTELQSYINSQCTTQVCEDEAEWRFRRSYYQEKKNELFADYVDAQGCGFFYDENSLSHDPRGRILSAAELDALQEYQAEVECNVSCRGNADAWLSAIAAQCTTLAASQTLQDQLYDMLIEYCLDHCGLPDPMGTLTNEKLTNWPPTNIQNFLSTNCGSSTLFDDLEQPDPVTYELDGNNNRVTQPCVEWDPCMVSVFEYLNENHSGSSIVGSYPDVESDPVLLHCFPTAADLEVYGNSGTYANRIRLLDGSGQELLNLIFTDVNGNDMVLTSTTKIDFPLVEVGGPGRSGYNDPGPGSSPVTFELTKSRLNNAGQERVRRFLYVLGSPFSNVNGNCYVATDYTVPSGLTAQWFDTMEPCSTLLQNIARDQARVEWERQVQVYLDQHLEAYRQKCLSFPFVEEFHYEHTPKEYHYTLYYYDQAGNLVQTVPPEGVDILDPSTVQKWENGTATAADNPEHRMATVYRYNSLNQLVWQSTPDGGETEFWYDGKDRLRFSQDARQAAMSTPRFSYSKYDALGRTEEVGEVEDLAAPPMQSEVDDLTFPDRATYSLRDITTTYWDEDYTGLSFADNLRTRIFEVRRESSEGVLSAKSYYSYDDHGNVKELRQVIPGLGMKRMTYDYELISGNVNRVDYQPGQVDYFGHRYLYDADNRITHAFTSRDGLIWDRDARYFYYPHGPLARVEIGEDDVQGNDYLYSIHGWIKGVNMPGGDDPSGDGDYATSGNRNAYVAKDEFAFGLGFYGGDYTPIGGVNVDLGASLGDPNGSTGWRQLVRGQDGLYNGNIAFMVTELDRNGRISGLSAGGVNGMAYEYDQLQRIRTATTHRQYNPTSKTWGSTATNEYNTAYTYDGNGNIETLERYGISLHSGNPTTEKMDEFTYRYVLDANGEKIHNRLRHVNDAQGLPQQGSGGPTGPWTYFDNDLDDQGEYFVNGNPTNLPNYEYDETGRLLQDAHEGIERIGWDNYDKVVSVERSTNAYQIDGKANLFFDYDGMGNRVSKRVETYVSGGPDAVKTQFYVRDAQGNPMAVYEQELNGNILETKLVEHAIYGSERLGLDRNPVMVEEKCVSGCGYSDDGSGDGAALRVAFGGLMYDSPLAGSGGTEAHTGEYVTLVNTTSGNVSLENYSLVHTGTGESAPLNTFGELGPGQVLVLGNMGTMNDGQRLAVSLPESALTLDPDSAQSCDLQPVDADLEEFYKVNLLPELGFAGACVGVGDVNLALPDEGGVLELRWSAASEETVVDRIAYGEAVDGLVAENGDVSAGEMGILSGREAPLGIKRVAYTNAQAGNVIPQGEALKGQFVVSDEDPLAIPAPSPYIEAGTYALQRTGKVYELKNHLGNVLTVVEDIKFAQDAGGSASQGEYYFATVEEVTDYYPFGMAMPGRTWSNGYRYGFNGMEKDDEIKGSGNSYDFGLRNFDPRIARMWSNDPRAKEYPWQTTYAYHRNSPIWKIDYLGGGDDKKRASNPNNPNSKGGTQKFHQESVALRKHNQELQEDNCIKVTLESGGIDDSKITLDATVIVSDVPQADGLQIIQTVDESSKVYGTNGQFVDGGKNSPAVVLNGEAPGDPKEPYYMPKSWYNEPGSTMINTWNSNTGGGKITAFDRPTATLYIKKVSFETVIIATNYRNSGTPKALASFSWGYDNFGTTPLHSSFSLNTTSPGFSNVGMSILKNDYPGFKFYTPSLDSKNLDRLYFK